MYSIVFPLCEQRITTLYPAALDILVPACLLCGSDQGRGTGPCRVEVTLFKVGQLWRESKK